MSQKRHLLEGSPTQTLRDTPFDKAERDRTRRDAEKKLHPNQIRGRENIYSSRQNSPEATDHGFPLDSTHQETGHKTERDSTRGVR